MGYHIFMARKVQLTTLKNNAYASMMNEWIEQQHLADEELSLMTDKNSALSDRSNTYRTQRDEKNRIYDHYAEAYRASLNYQNAVANGDTAAANKAKENFESKWGDSSSDDYIDITSSDVKNADEAYREHEGIDYNRDLNQLSDDFKDDKQKIEDDYSVDYQMLTDQETRIEQAIQVLETHISEYTQEMSKAEQQEAAEIKTCIPNYNGAGGGQG